MQRRATFLLLSISCAPAPVPEEPKPDTNLPLHQLGVSDSLRHVKAGFYVIRTRTDWVRYVRKRWIPTLPAPPTAPSIDFTKSMVVTLEGYSAQICYPTPVFRQARIVADTLRVQLGDLNGPCAMAGRWVEAVELPRSRRPIVLLTNNWWDAAHHQSMLQQRPLP